MVQILAAVAFLVFVAGPAIAAFLPHREPEGEPKANGRLRSFPALSMLRRA